MATSTTTVTGRLLDATGSAVANEYVYFRLKTSGADNDVSPNEVYSSKSVEALTDSSGDISVTLWVNGESDIESVYQVATKNGRITPTDVIIPTSATSGTIDIAELLINHVATGSNVQQSTVYAEAIQRANHTGIEDLNGEKLILSPDGLTWWESSSNSQARLYLDSDILFNIAPDSFSFVKSTGAPGFTADGSTGVFSFTGLSPDLGGSAELILDADSDTSISATVDDQIKFEIAGSAAFTMTATNAGYLSSLNQDLGTGDDVTHNTLSLGQAASSSVYSIALSTHTGFKGIGVGANDFGYYVNGTQVWSSQAGANTMAVPLKLVASGDIETTDIEAEGSAGLTLANSAGTTVLTVGAGGSTDVTAAGGVNVTGNLTVSGDTIIATETPASATATGTAGQIAWDADYFYVAVETNTWKRAALSTW